MSRPARPLPSRNGWIRSLSVDDCQRLGDGPIRIAQPGRTAQPLGHRRGNFCPVRWAHAAREWLNVVPAERSRSFAGPRVRMRVDVPRPGHRESVDVANLGQGDELAGRPAARLQALLVDPLGGISVATDFHVLGQLLVADSATLAEEDLDFTQDERVALDRGRVVGLLVPDVAPDVLRLDRTGQAAEAASELLDAIGELAVDGFPASAAATLLEGHSPSIPQVVAATAQKWTRRNSSANCVDLCGRIRTTQKPQR